MDFKYDLVAPDNYTVVPNHRGYDYLADKLASRGYIVVSINADRGITGSVPGTTGDLNLIIARGRLVLRHLQRLSEWNANGGTPPSLGVDLQGKLDFSNVGLMGHSRGGEGVRAAHSIYTTPGSESTMWHGLIPNLDRFKGVFEIAPTDVRKDETGTGLVADGTNWNVLLPVCDGDVYTLEGVRAFDRLLALTTISSENPTTPKSTYTVWGANHNFYNTEWKSSEYRHDALVEATLNFTRWALPDRPHSSRPAWQVSSRSSEETSALPQTRISIRTSTRVMVSRQSLHQSPRSTAVICRRSTQSITSWVKTSRNR